MSLLSSFLTKKPISDGALIDTRPPSEKAKDYKAEEVVLTGSPVVFQNPKITKLPGAVYSQERTNSCVPHAFFTQLEYEGIVPFGMSQLRAYRKRYNYPAGGSAGPDMYNQIKSGQNRNIDAPVFPGHTDALANTMPYVLGDKLIKDFTYFFISDYTKIPGLVAGNKAIAIFIYASENEWGREYVEVKDNVKLETASVRHAVTLVKRGDFTENGKRWLTVHDSAAFGGRHLRYISYDFLLRRCYYAAEVFAKGEVPTPPAPPMLGNPTVPCKLNDKGQDVLNLQSFLIKGKFLEPQYLTGFYGNLTAKAVLWWQLYNHKKFTPPIPDLLALKGESWGPQSIAALK